MNTTTSKIARYFALPIVSAGIIGGAALGMAAMANAATSSASDPHQAAPTVQAHPAPEAQPGWHGHHGVWHIQNLQPGYHR